jgi:hypothetical protein
VKNLKAKTRPISDPYETFTHDGWTWKIVKHYQAADAELKNQYARVFCFVTSPLCPEGEYGDTWCRDIPGYMKNLIDCLAVEMALLSAK